MEPTFTPVAELGEFGLIDRMRETLGAVEDPDLLAGIADDAAVYRVGEGRVHVVTTDALIEGIHFDRHFMPMEFLGFKAMTVNVSDVAAMNARPRWATIALGLPHNVSVEMVASFYEGVRKACALYGLTVVGGDTTASRLLTVSVTVIGEAQEEDVIYRRGAQVGDLLCVTGDVGASYAGLRVLLGQRKAVEMEGDDYKPDLSPYQYVIGRHLTPRARVDMVKAWAEAGVRPTSLIDVSDGIASEVHHLCAQSGVGARVRETALPIDLETRTVADLIQEDADTFALFGGEDYELLFTIAKKDLAKLDQEKVHVIGEITAREEGVQLEMAEGDVLPLDVQGYDHFG